MWMGEASVVDDRKCFGRNEKMSLSRLFERKEKRFREMRDEAVAKVRLSLQMSLHDLSIARESMYQFRLLNYILDPFHGFFVVPPPPISWSFSFAKKRV